MKITVFYALSLLSLACHASPEGRILWKPEESQESVSHVSAGSILMFPDVPINGKAPRDAVLIGIIDSGINNEMHGVSSNIPTFFSGLLQT